MMSSEPESTSLIAGIYRGDTKLGLPADKSIQILLTRSYITAVQYVKLSEKVNQNMVAHSMAKEL